MTIVAVAHRLATIQTADVIFVLDDGKIGTGSKVAEHDSHLDLLKRKGIYWQMVSFPIPLVISKC